MAYNSYNSADKNYSSPVGEFDQNKYYEDDVQQNSKSNNKWLLIGAVIAAILILN